LGLGEQTLSYMLLTTLYDVFPALAIFSIHQWVKPSDSSSCRTLGCWRDIKHICYYVKENTAQQYDHPLVDICIEIANNQLRKDIQTWKCSLHCYSNLHISNVAKHIPREKSSTKFSWLFKRFAIDWIRKSKPYLLQTTRYMGSLRKALSKSKCIYRKQLSFMNKALLTFQRSNYIENQPNIDNITPNTIMRQPSFFFNGDTDFSKKLIANSDFINNENTFMDHKDFTSFTNGYSYSSIPIYHIIKEAFRIINEDSYNISDAYTSFINITWKNILKSFSTFNASFIPLVDVSDSINTNSFFSSIGYAMIISSISHFSNRFIAIDVKPTWVSFDGTAQLTNQILHIQQTISGMQNGSADFNMGTELVAHTLTQINSSIAFCNDMKIVLFSPFHKSIDFIQLRQTFQSYGLLTHPTFVFWNMSLEQMVDLPCTYTNSECLLLSGHAISNVHYLIHYSNKKLSVYDSIVDRLIQPRYQGFSDYLHQIIAAG
jgi:hypothetical protein